MSFDGESSSLDLRVSTLSRRQLASQQPTRSSRNIDEVAERENEKFGQFVGKQVSEIRAELGLPTDDYIDELGNETLVYKTKKYGIPCERKFEVNSNLIVIGFVSNGCF